MFKGERKRSGAANDSTSGGVLGTMAWAHELILRLIPGDDTTEMGAHCVEGVKLKISLIVIDNEVGGITAKALDELARIGVVRVEILGLLDFISKGVFRDGTTRAAAGGLRDEEVGKWTQDAQGYGGGGAE